MICSEIHISFTTFENTSQTAEHIFAQLDTVMEHSALAIQLCQEALPTLLSSLQPSTVKALFKREQLITVEIPQACLCLFFSITVTLEIQQSKPHVHLLFTQTMF